MIFDTNGAGYKTTCTYHMIYDTRLIQALVQCLKVKHNEIHYSKQMADVNHWNRLEKNTLRVDKISCISISWSEARSSSELQSKVNICIDVNSLMIFCHDIHALCVIKQTVSWIINSYHTWYLQMHIMGTKCIPSTSSKMYINFLGKYITYKCRIKKSALLTYVFYYTWHRSSMHMYRPLITYTMYIFHNARSYLLDIW